MTEFADRFGFQDALHPPVKPKRARITRSVLRPGPSKRSEAARATLARVARRSPEVMVKITGKTRDAGHLGRHFDYISRNGRLPLEGPDGELLEGRGAIKMLAQDWAAETEIETTRRRDAALSMSIVLSMPRGTDAFHLEDASRAFAQTIFGERFPYVFALHDEDGRPHVHLTVRMLGRDGERLNPRKADLQLWRETFAEALRARGVEAEATPRRARGVVRKPEAMPVRKIQDRHSRGEGPAAWTVEKARREAPWEVKTLERQKLIRMAYVAEALSLKRSSDPDERAMGAALEGFVRHLPRPETRDMMMRREREADGGRTEPDQPRGLRGRGR